jgi:hypothetical protein
MTEEITVPLGLLRRYLVVRGWRQTTLAMAAGTALDGDSYADRFFRERAVGARNVDLFVLDEPGEERVELAVPRLLDTRETYRRLLGALDTLSQLEGRGPLDIVNSVRSIAFDIVKSRVPDSEVYDDTINLNQAVTYTAKIKRLLAAGATTEIVPDAYFLRLKKEGKDYADHCRFGHTFKGSFGFTIESPVIQNPSPSLPGMESMLEAPFERKVINRLARGVRVIQEAVAVDDPSVIVKGYESGFSANMCEEFVTLVEETSPSGLGFAFTFSPEWPAESFLEAFIGRQHIEITRSAAKSMREKVIVRPETIFGRITRLQNEADPTDMFDVTHDREVVVHWQSKDGDLNVRVSLGATEYLLAAQAHLSGRPIQVSGNLKREGRRWVLENPAGLTQH